MKKLSVFLSIVFTSFTTSDSEFKTDNKDINKDNAQITDSEPNK